jgi:hypothetical protein
VTFLLTGLFGGCGLGAPSIAALHVVFWGLGTEACVLQNLAVPCFLWRRFGHCASCTWDLTAHLAAHMLLLFLGRICQLVFFYSTSSGDLHVSCFCIPDWEQGFGIWRGGGTAWATLLQHVLEDGRGCVQPFPSGHMACWEGEIGKCTAGCDVSWSAPSWSAPSWSAPSWSATEVLVRLLCPVTGRRISFQSIAMRKARLKAQ